jgi:hypothetical protein
MHSCYLCYAYMAIQLGRERQLFTYTLFVDLIKAFDTANHELLFALQF